jgi:prevent-host-death family protein
MGAPAVDIANVRIALKQFSTYANRVAFGRERFRVLRRGKPVVALVSVEDLDRLERPHTRRKEHHR